MYEPHIISVRVWSPPMTRRGSVSGAFGRRVVAARVFDDPKQVLVRHDHHVVLGVDGDGAEGGVGSLR